MLRCLITVVAFFDYEHKLSHICVVCGGYLAGCAFVTFFHLSFFAYLCTAEHNVFTLLYPRTVSHYRSIETSSQVTHKELNPRACPHVFFLLFFLLTHLHTLITAPVITPCVYGVNLSKPQYSLTHYCQMSTCSSFTKE